MFWMKGFSKWQSEQKPLLVKNIFIMSKVEQTWDGGERMVGEARGDSKERMVKGAFE